jgi:integrase
MPKNAQRMTDLSIRNLPVPERGQLTYDDEGSPLKVRVSQGGTKSFVVMLGSGKRYTIGRYGEISLAEARSAARRLKAEKVLGRIFPEVISLAQARDLYLSQIDVRPATKEYYVRHLQRLKATRVGDITPRDINRILDRLPGPTRAQALASFRSFFNWCLKRRYLDRSPCERMSAPPSSSRSRVLSDAELLRIWEATAEPSPYSLIVRLLICTGQRKGEIAALETSWISADRITLPAGVTKNGREHTFPKGRLCAEVLAQAVEGASAEGRLFAAGADRANPFSGWSARKKTLDRRMGNDIAHWTLHDLRRTFATNLAALGTPIHVTEKLLNHVSGTSGGLVAVYQRHAYFDEMRTAIEAWETRLRTMFGIGETGSHG